MFEYSLILKLLTEHHLEGQNLTTCQNATLLEISCTGSFISIHFRIVGYVAEANETRKEKREKLKVLKKHTPKPEINFVTVGSYFMCGKIIGNIYFVKANL